jgi:hypothetical protein
MRPFDKFKEQIIKENNTGEFGEYLLDPKIAYLVMLINANSDFETAQSCQGHTVFSGVDENEYPTFSVTGAGVTFGAKDKWDFYELLEIYPKGGNIIRITVEPDWKDSKWYYHIRWNDPNLGSNEEQYIVQQYFMSRADKTPDWVFLEKFTEIMKKRF